MIAILKYNAGNAASVKYALDRLEIESLITNDKQELAKADKIIFPGVGAASTAMQFLHEKDMVKFIYRFDKPFLAVCLGLQLLCTSSEEGKVDCLGIVDAEVKRFPPADRVPHMGWNDLKNLRSPLFNNIHEKEDVYFVHSYYAECCENTIAECDYIKNFSAALQKDNYFGTQFHPEKSAEKGAQILINFSSL